MPAEPIVPESDAPETVTEAVQLLQVKGYDAVLTVERGEIHCAACAGRHDAEALTVHHTYRFEGESDPGDEAIVLGVEIGDCGARGIIVSAYGPDADPELLALIAQLMT